MLSGKVGEANVKFKTNKALLSCKKVEGPLPPVLSSDASEAFAPRPVTVYVTHNNVFYLSCSQMLRSSSLFQFRLNFLLREIFQLRVCISLDYLL